jgi:tetratricopeptide (TPR) repeat protein
MHKFLIFVLLIATFAIQAQDSKYNLKTDTVTYRYYLNGDWNKLIDTAKQALKNDIDFKYLRQRLGYAYFVKGNYYASQQQYEKALKFDKEDIDTRTYLYYCGLNTTNEANTRYRAGLLPDELKKTYGIKPFRIVNSVDLEYCYKANDNVTRGNPGYYRAGISSQLGYRLSLYQSVSAYAQKNEASYSDNSGLFNVLTNDSTAIRQYEYFALLDWTITPHISFNAGYHYLSLNINNKIASTYQISNNQKFRTVNNTSQHMPGNMFCSRLSFTLNRFDFALTGSILNYDSILTQQYGVHAGVVLPGKLNLTLKSSLYGMLTPNNSRLIFSQTASVLLSKKLTLEANATWGNLNNFSDNNGLYIYNSLDPTTFRTGLTAYWHLLPKIWLFGNYTYDTKLIELNNTNYNQHSFSGGIIWKM